MVTVLLNEKMQIFVKFPMMATQIMDDCLPFETAIFGLSLTYI